MFHYNTEKQNLPFESVTSAGIFCTWREAPVT